MKEIREKKAIRQTVKSNRATEVSACLSVITLDAKALNSPSKKQHLTAGCLQDTHGHTPVERESMEKDILCKQ